MLIAIPSCIGLLVLGEPVLNLLFSTRETNPLAAQLLQIGCITVIMYSFSTITNGILQGIGKVSVPAKNALVALVGHLIVLAVCLWGFKMDVYGVLNFRSIKKNLPEFHLEYRKTFILPFISAAIMGVAAYLFYQGMIFVCHKNSISVLLAIVVAVLVYALALLKTKAMDEEDLKNFPKGTKLLKLAKKMHLL